MWSHTPLSTQRRWVGRRVPESAAAPHVKKLQGFVRQAGWPFLFGTPREGRAVFAHNITVARRNVSGQKLLQEDRFDTARSLRRRLQHRLRDRAPSLLQSSSAAFADCDCRDWLEIQGLLELGDLERYVIRKSDMPMPMSSLDFVSAPPSTRSRHTSLPTTTAYTALALDETQDISSQALALLPPTPTTTNPFHRHQQRRAAAPTSSPRHAAFTRAGATPDPAAADAGVVALDWQTQQSTHAAPQYNSMGGLVTSHSQESRLERHRSHARTPSASTVASTRPNTPYMNTTSLYAHIANTDHAPHSPAHFAADLAFNSKNLPIPSQTPIDTVFIPAGYVPSASADIPNAHLAVPHFGFDHHNEADFTPDSAPSRQSMSSCGNDSPATPQSGAGDTDAKNYNVPQSDYRQSHPNVQLFRTDSQPFQDELYNPNQIYASAPKSQHPQQSQQQYLSPPRNLVTERLQTANLARSASPVSAISRERSPFRDGSLLAPPKHRNGPDMKIGNAVSMRQQQKDAAAEAEYAKHRVPLRRESTKTISPKNALLDYTGEDQPPLFQDSIPDGYKQHMGGTVQWQSNFMGLPSTTYHGLPTTTSQQTMGFRITTGVSADNNGYAAATFDIPSLPQSTLQDNPFEAGNYQAAIAAKMNQYAEAAPEFPAALPSMETSISDVGPQQSPQDSVGPAPPTPSRPDDTRANTGTYTCTYHGCTQRFNSHNELQMHKRDYHRSQQRQPDYSASASGTASTSPRSIASPDPSTNGMTSTALLARNSQAGPHKCARINPSTGKPCNTIFSRPYDLTRHEDTIHNNRKRKVRCPLCREEKTFSRSDALTRHMRVVHPEVEAFGKRSRRGD